jgi:hypothetical protein
MVNRHCALPRRLACSVIGGLCAASLLCLLTPLSAPGSGQGVLAGPALPSGSSAPLAVPTGPAPTLPPPTRVPTVPAPTPPPPARLPTPQPVS